MRTCFFWAAQFPKALELLDEHAPFAERVFTGNDDYHYWRELCARWTGSTDLVVMEQDIGIHERVLPSFAECPEPWCVFTYPLVSDGVCANGLGCTKFSAELQRQAPLGEPCVHCSAVCHRHVDGAVVTAVSKIISSPHVHEPPVRHFHYEGIQ